jgi:hypothetical protein
MMKNKIIKVEKTLYLSGIPKLPVILCLFVFSSFLSAQIFQSNDTQIVISKGTVITQDFSQKQARIYIAEGTTVTGLQPIQNITLIYLEKSEKIKQNLAKNRSKAERKTVQQAPNKETAVPKEIIKESNDQNIFLFSTNCTTAVAPTTTQNIKLLAFIPKEVKNNITTTNSSKKSSFERRNLLKLSICLTINSIRPPPFI